jgi:CRISPR-associated protein Csm4
VTLFRIGLRLKGPFVTPFASGTLFGMVCVALAERDGETALADWLRERKRLWGLSDVFPAGLLPRPLLAAAPQPADRDTAKAKAIRRHRFVTRHGFLATRNALSSNAIEPHLRSAAAKTVRLVHNTIDRMTGSTPEEGGLFFVDEDWSWDLPRSDGDAVSTGPDRDLYVEAEDGDIERVRSLISDVGERGFGRKAGLGRGQFRVLSVSRDTELERGPGDRRMSLSRGAVTSGMGDVRARIAPHFGKAGPQVAVAEGAAPFKRPLLLTEPGATFLEERAGRHGAWLTDVHPTRPEIGHNAFHVTVGFCEASS